MKWYFAISEGSFEKSKYDWPELIRAAVNSAKKNTSLVPHLIYDGHPNSFINEIRSMGVTIIPHRISFYDALLTDKNIDVASFSGAYLRNEIPIIEKDDPYVLYTDCDVVFLKEPQFLANPPKFFSAAPEETKQDYFTINTGVMVINVPAMRKELPEFIAFIKGRISAGKPEDQPMYNLFYRGRLDHLDVTLNWKPYWGLDPSAQIVHWHGPKPDWARKALDNLQVRAKIPAWKRLLEKDVSAYREFLNIWGQFGSFRAEDAVGAEDIVCVLEFLKDGHASGWAIDRNDPDRPVRMNIIIDGENIGDVVCSKQRPDVKKAGQPTDIVGYEFKLPEQYMRGARHRLEFKSVTTENSYLIHCPRGQLKHYDFTSGGEVVT